MSDAPTDVLDDLKDVFEVKNDDYGNSWEKVGAIKRIMADENGPELVTLYEDGTYDIVDEDKPTKARVGRGDEGETVEAVVLSDTPQKNSTFEENVDDLLTRLLDKLIRVYTLTFLKDEPAVEDESLTDGAEDACGYTSMLASLIRRQ